MKRFAIAPAPSSINGSRNEASTKVSEALDFAKSNGRGVTGLRRVLQALETGEVQSHLPHRKLFCSSRRVH
jgi:hypothetical protein